MGPPHGPTPDPGAEPDPGTHPIEGVAFAAPEQPPAAGAPPVAGTTTGPVAARPTVRPRRRGPVTRMGPWAPVAGALLGTLLGLVAVLLLAGTADGFRERLALVLLVVGMGLLGASGPLLADEVRLVRRGVREAVVRPASVEVTAGLLNGLTPARLLLLVSGFVLFLAAYVVRG
ncbi:hypothetical protein ACI8AF_10785 [Blastococcus sp. SYSU D00669]